MKKVDGCNSFRAWGRRGQFIVVVPELDLVIAVTSNPVQPHPPTSIHYNPLFDLVAAAVKRNRPPKKPLVAVDLPLDVKAFIADYNQARYNKDMEKMSDLISDRFLHEGVTKQMALSTPKHLLLSAAATQLTLNTMWSTTQVTTRHLVCTLTCVRT